MNHQQHYQQQQEDQYHYDHYYDDDDDDNNKNSTSSSLYSEIPSSFPYVRQQQHQQNIQTNNFNRQPQRRHLNQQPEPGMSKIYRDHSFVRSDFIFDSDNTLQKFYNTRQKRSCRRQQQQHEYSSNINHPPAAVNNNYYQPIFYPPTLPSTALQPYYLNSHCHYFNGYCHCLQPIQMYNRMNPCLYPTIRQLNDPLQQRLLYMETDGTLGLEAIRIEKPLSNALMMQPYHYQHAPSSTLVPVVRPSAPPLVRTSKQRNSSYNASIRNRVGSQHRRIPMSASSNDQFNEMNKIRMAPPPPPPPVSTSNRATTPSNKSKMKNSKTFCSTQFDSIENKFSAKRGGDHSKLTQQQNNVIFGDNISNNTTTKSFSPDKDSIHKIDENLLMITEPSLSSLDDFVRSPYHKITHNLDAGQYQSDYSTDRVSVDSTMIKSLNNFLNRQAHLSTSMSTSHQLPVFVVKPKSLVAHTGDTVKFRCSYFGLPTPKCTWFLNKINLNEQLSAKYRIYFKNGYCFLKIFNLKLHDSGKIVCLVENLFGKVQASVNLIVLYKTSDDKQKSLTSNQTQEPLTTNQPPPDVANEQIENHKKDAPIIFNENIIYKLDHYISPPSLQQTTTVDETKNQSTMQQHQQTSSFISRDEIRQLIIEHLILRDRSTTKTNTTTTKLVDTPHSQILTYRVNRPGINAPETSKQTDGQHFYHKIPVKCAQFDDSEDTSEVTVNVNDRVTITTSNEKSAKSYWLHPKGFTIQNCEKYCVFADENTLKLDIPSIQIDDSGKYKCIKNINNKEEIVSCNILVKRPSF